LKEWDCDDSYGLRKQEPMKMGVPPRRRRRRRRMMMMMVESQVI
jgi:hypothetical protein